MHSISLATIGVCVFYAVTSVAAFFMYVHSSEELLALHGKALKYGVRRDRIQEIDMKKKPKCKLTDAMLSEIAREAEQQLMDEMTENMPEHIWTKGWDDVLQRAAEQDTFLLQEK